jgi:hypothetical protein
MHLSYHTVTDRLMTNPLYKSGLPYFSSWRTARWFLVMLLPVFGSSVAFWTRTHGAEEALIIGLLGAHLAAGLFVALCSGKITSCWGTHERRLEPKCFAGQLALETAVYVGISAAGYFA